MTNPPYKESKQMLVKGIAAEMQLALNALGENRLGEYDKHMERVEEKRALLAHFLGWESS